jgi:amidophosphoribosyltransferase
VNCEELAIELKSKARRHLLTHSDTEIILNLFAEGLSQFPNDEFSFDAVCSSIQEIFRKVNGSYSIVTLVADQGLVAFRDPYGIRPLIWGKKKMPNGKDAHIVASESVSLSFLGYQVVRDIQPGEVLWISKDGEVQTRLLKSTESRHCMFEWVYFASPESVMDGVPVYGTRINLGKNLAKLIQKQMIERRIEADLVVPVPETSRIAAIALAEELRIPYREVLIKNRYIKRTFILDSQQKRQNAVNLKLSPVHSEIKGKRVLLVDDSIVRGTTSKKIIELVRNAGASQVYFVSTCPPIQFPCYYGIDFPDQSELVAAGRDLRSIEKALAADAVIYQDLRGLQQSILEAGGRGFSSRPCMACLDGNYPTDITSGIKFASTRTVDRKERK